MASFLLFQDPQASYDLNDDDPDPMPKFNELNG